MFSRRLNETRKAKGFTAQNMADQLGLTLRSYQFYEGGKRSPSFETLVKIADILDVPIDFLLCRDDFLQSRGVSSDGHPINLPKNPIE
jgi:transcriptional regulator with XRE-family HTH domain